jgi:hypothetical protein
MTVKQAERADTLLQSDIIASIEFLHPGNSVFEICAFDRYGKPLAGWFRDKAQAVAEVQRISKDPTLKAIYITLNPCHDALLSRSNQIKPVKSRTQDVDILNINHLYIDADAVRPSDTNSSDEEHELAISKIHDIKHDLSEQEWPEPLCGDSGNGGMLVYCIEPQPNTEETKKLIQTVLKALAERYDTPLVNIDQKVHNPARIAKLLGTMTRKGDPAPDRPQRLSRILSIPEKQELVTLKQLQKFTSAVKQETKLQTEDRPDNKLDVPAYLSHYGREIIKTKQNGTSTLFCLKECVFDSSHAPNEAAIVQADNGALGYQCFHNSCKNKTWQDARQVISGTDNLRNYLLSYCPSIYSADNKDNRDNAGISTVCELDLSRALRTGRELQVLDMPVLWAVNNLIPLESITLLSARGGMGKTTVKIQTADAISKGSSFLGLETIQRPVVYVDFENSLPVLIDRIKRIGASDVLFWHTTNDIKPPRLDSKEWELYKRLPKGAVIIIDTLRAAQSRDENDSQHMAFIMQRLKELRDLGYTIILLHHTPKANDRIYKGSTAIFDLSDHVLSLHKVRKGSYQEVNEDEDFGDCCYRFGTRDKTRYEPFHMFLEFDSDKKIFTVAPDPDTNDLEAIQQILEAKGNLNQSQIFELVKEELNIKSKSKLVSLLRKGNNKFWTPESKGKAVYYSVLSHCPDIYRGDNRTIEKNLSENEKTDALSDTSQSIDNPTLSYCPDGSKTIETDEEITVLEVINEI